MMYAILGQNGYKTSCKSVASTLGHGLKYSTFLNFIYLFMTLVWLFCFNKCLFFIYIERFKSNICYKQMNMNSVFS